MTKGYVKDMEDKDYAIKYKQVQNCTLPDNMKHNVYRITILTL